MIRSDAKPSRRVALVFFIILFFTAYKPFHRFFFSDHKAKRKSSQKETPIGEFRPLRRATRGSASCLRKPLKRLERNFYMRCAPWPCQRFMRTSLSSPLARDSQSASISSSELYSDRLTRNEQSASAADSPKANSVSLGCAACDEHAEPLET